MQHEKSKESKEIKDYEYKIVNDGIALTKYLGDETDVVIPSTYEGYNVVELNETFRNNKK